MTRGELYLVRNPRSGDPRRQRVFVIVSRQALVSARFSSVVCAPVYSRYDGLTTQVRVGVAEGLKHESSVHCDELVSVPKTALTRFVGTLDLSKLKELNFALRRALDLDATLD